ncbi:MAG: glycosyltransferase [Bacteroidota bacterium]
MSKPPKVLFLTKYPTQGASSRYRVYQYLQDFKEIEFETQSLMSQEAFDLLYRKGSTKKKIWLSLKDYWQRLRFIIAHSDADIFYMQRELFAFGPLWLEKILRRQGKKLVFDLDDALFINKQNASNPFSWDKAARVIRIMQQVDLVVAGNPWLAKQSLQLGAKQAVHIDVAEKVLFENEVREGHLKALWLGSPTTSKYLKFIEQPLAKLQAEIDLSIEIVGGDSAHDFQFKATYKDWTPQAERLGLLTSHIGLMPLPDEDWSKGKCGGKARTYMASGVVPVVSDIGYNQLLIDHGKRGFLCKTADDWKNAILQLARNPELMTSIREEDYRYVKQHFSRTHIAQQLEKMLLDLVD